VKWEERAGMGWICAQMRRAIALELINEYGLSISETARRLGMSASGLARY
jgi:predicted transcriptional regulator